MFELAVAQAEQFSAADFARLSFLEGRWRGEGPDGKPFFDIYDRPDATTLRSRRYADDTFSSATDESRVTLENGQIISRWGPYSWRASRIEADRAEFEAVEAPSRFSWRATEPDTVEVIQSFTGPDGQAQTYAMTLTRLP